MRIRNIQCLQYFKLVGAGHNGDFQITLSELFECVQFIRIAPGHQQAFTVRTVGFREQYLLATLGQDCHFCCHHIETPGFQTGNQRSESGGFPSNAIDAQSVSHMLRNFRPDAFCFARQIHIAIWNFICNRYADFTSVLDFLKGDSLYRGSAEKTQHTGRQTSSKKAGGFHAGRPVWFRYQSLMSK